jgi:hypothetical protein
LDGFDSQAEFGKCQTLSPQLIMFRVATGKSWANRAESSAAFSQEIRFAAPAQPNHSDDDLSDVQIPDIVEKETATRDKAAVV